MSNLLVTWWMPEESQGLETWGRVRQGIGRQGAREAEGGGERDGRKAEPEFWKSEKRPAVWKSDTPAISKSDTNEAGKPKGTFQDFGDKQGEVIQSRRRLRSTLISPGSQGLDLKMEDYRYIQIV